MENSVGSGDFVERWLPQIERSLREYLPSSLPNIEKQFDDAVESALFSGADRLHATLALLGAEMFDGKAGNILPAGVAVEFVYAGSLLLHRSGSSVSREKYDEDILLSAGLGLLNAAYGLIFANTNVQAERAIQAHNELVEYVGAGNLLASAEESNAELDNEPRISKGAASMRLAVRIGAILAGANYLQLEAISRFGGFFGAAWRLKQELSNLQTNEENLTAEMERAELIHRLNLAIGEAKQILTDQFASNEPAGILLKLTDSLAV